LKPFIGVDGEGGGTDELGRQNFLLLAAGDAELFNNNRPLSTVECLEFLLALPRDAILVGYFFTYDATQILRDLPVERLKHLLREKDKDDEPVRGGGNGEKQKRRTHYTYWGNYAVAFVPRQYFRVARANGRGMGVLPGSSRTINEVGGFFQKSFVEAIKNWNVGDAATVEMIAANKERRSGFTQVDTEIRRYCTAECALLAELMHKLREVALDAGIAPRSWRGAGWLAAKLHEVHATPKRKELSSRPPELAAAAIRAYYGGRFEIVRVGRIAGPVWEYDINSAYPAAMLKLPCPHHTEWRPFAGAPNSDGIGRWLRAAHGNVSRETFVANVSFDHSNPGPLYGFPVRQKGRLFWPQQGRGTYWAPEIEAAVAAGARITEWHGAWKAYQMCACRPFDWLPAVYDYRKSLGGSTRGYPIKLGINGLYGKLAQRQGAAPWRDHIAAGLITAYVRAALIRAYAADPEAVVMIATDSLFALRPLHENAPEALRLGGTLGEWEMTERPSGLFIVQPGIYWSPGSETLPKTRGIPRSKIIERRGEFEAVWQSWCDDPHSFTPPHVSVPLTNFIGHRLALARGKPELAGSWVPAPKTISFDWAGKRSDDAVLCDSALLTAPKPGFYVSEPYDPAALTDLAEQLLELEAQPDYEPLGNSGE